jgi:ribosomal protein L40E
MKGPLQVIRRRRSERPANETGTAQAATEAPTEAQPAADSGSAAPAPTASPAPAPTASPTPAPTASPTPGPTASPAPAPTASEPPPTGEPPTAEVPAGQEPVPERPSFRQRGRLRRRLRYLRRVRELGFRDLGGLVFDQHKFARVNEELVRSKLTALAAVDAELRALEHALDDRRPLTELREPGISVCPRCGALHGSDARYCPSCGVPVRGPRAIAEVGEAVSLSVGQIGAIAATSTPPPSAQPPSQLTLHAEPPAAEPPVTAVAEPEPQPAVTEVAEREAAKAEQPTSAAERPVSAAEQQASDADQSAAGPEPPGPGEDQPTEAMPQVDGDAADGARGPVAQPSGERRES